MRQVFAGILALVSVNALATTSPVGLWKTIDDVSGQPKSIVSITQTADNQLVGKVVKLFKDSKRLCTECEGANHNKPIVGLTVMHGLKPNTEQRALWENGEILDPKSGKTYHCTARVLEGGKKLQVRGYIGLPLFGRAQTWIKES